MKNHSARLHVSYAFILLSLCIGVSGCSDDDKAPMASTSGGAGGGGSGSGIETTKQRSAAGDVTSAGVLDGMYEIKKYYCVGGTETKSLQKMNESLRSGSFEMKIYLKGEESFEAVKITDAIGGDKKVSGRYVVVNKIQLQSSSQNSWKMTESYSESAISKDSAEELKGVLRLSILTEASKQRTIKEEEAKVPNQEPSFTEIIFDQPDRYRFVSHPSKIAKDIEQSMLDSAGIEDGHDSEISPEFCKGGDLAYEAVRKPLPQKLD
jgi:hypothetical protein